MIAQRGTDAYKWIRRRVRATLRAHPGLDHTLGHLLRRLERSSPLASILRRDHALQQGLFRTGDLVLHHNPGDTGVVGSLARHGDYEPETREAIEGLLRPGDGFADLGAHIGYFTIIGARLVGTSGRVYAFEPIASTAEILRTNLARNGVDDAVEVTVSAITEATGEVPFELHPESSVSNKMAGPATPSTSLIPTTSLDSFFSKRGWPPVHLVKMDIEGAELDAFLGMSELCQRNPELAVIFELHLGNLERLGMDGRQLFATLRGLGFRRFTRLQAPVGRIQGDRGIDEALALAAKVNFNVLAQR